MTRRSMVVRDYMSEKLVTVDAKTDILHAAHIMINNHISGVPVIDKSGDLVGIITERDILASAIQAYYHGTRGGLVRDHMIEDPQTVGPNDSLMDVARLFINERFHRYPVVEDDRLIGVISRSDLMGALGEYYPL